MTTLRNPECSAIWENKEANKLSACTFQMFVTKMDEIIAEFGDSPRKQTKVETLIEGFKNVHNGAAAKKLIGQKFLISVSGKPLHVTTLPANTLKNMPLRQDFEQFVTPQQQQGTPIASGAFAAFGQPIQPKTTNDSDSKRIGLAAKQMFMALGASLEVIYAHEGNDLLIVQVIDSEQKPDAVASLVEAVFNSGEHPEGADNFRISFGLLKEIK